MGVDHFMKFYEQFEELDSIFLVCEFCNEGNLTSYFEKHHKSIPIKCVLKIIFEIGLGLSFLHKNRMTHRDLKSDNILIHNGVCKIGDFGFSNDVSRMETKLGTAPYMAPELVDHERKHYNNKVDIWALGVIMYNLMTSEYYFFKKRKYALYWEILSKPFSIPEEFREKWSPALQDLLAKCFRKDPKKRISIGSFLNHKVFSEIRPKYEGILEDMHSHIQLNGSLTREPVREAGKRSEDPGVLPGNHRRRR